MSHFEKGLAVLVAEVIHAYSPQAKGRVERLFGTFQDRVVKEMRLAEVTNIAESNTFLDGYLPEFNRMFAREAAQKADFHRPVVNKRELDTILSIKTDRALRNDFTISHNKKLYQIKSNIRAKKVTIEERTDGTMHIIHNSQKLKYQEIVTRPLKTEKLVERPKLVTAWKPSDSHPWKNPAKAMVKERTELLAAS